MAPNRKAILGAVVAGLLWPALLMPLAARCALAVEDYNVSINAGQTYVIRNLDRDATALVNFFGNARAFTVQSSSAGRFIVLGVEKGSGTITVARRGAKVSYHITVNAIFDVNHPLSPGTTPAPLTDDDGSKDYQHVSAATPATLGLPANIKPMAGKSVPDAGLASATSNSSISAEPGDSSPAHDVPSAAPSNSLASPPSGDRSVSSHSSLLDPGAGPVAAADNTLAAPARPAATTDTDAPRAPSASSDRTGQSQSDSAETSPAIHPQAGPGKATTTAPPKTMVLASVEPVAASKATPSAGSPPAKLAPSPHPTDTSAVGIVPSQSVNLPPLSSSHRFTSNPPASDQSGDRGQPVSGAPEPLPPEAILLTHGMSRIYDFPARMRRVSISDTSIADIQVINPHQLMLIGRQPGFATLAVWDRQGNVEERQILTDRRGAQQVMLNVVIAEINRGRLETEGLNYSTAFSKMGLSLVSLPGLVATPLGPQSGGTSGNSLPPGGSLIPMLLSPNLTYGLAAQNSNVLTQTFFQFLEDHNLGRVLARPRLLANSGERAKFLSGGEIPIIISQALNTSIVFKQFGTAVTFLPIVIGRHALQLTVKSEVSSPDFSQGVVESGFSVPGFVTRRAETVVRMAENQTLIIAGLILDQTTSNINKVPFLGDIPFLGYIFRTSNYNHSQSELVMTVTPEIVQAIPEGGQVALPTERAPLSREEIRTGPVNPPDVTRPRL